MLQETNPDGDVTDLGIALVGLVKKASKGKADGKAVTALLLQQRCG